MRKKQSKRFASARDAALKNFEDTVYDESRYTPNVPMDDQQEPVSADGIARFREDLSNVKQGVQAIIDHLGLEVDINMPHEEFSLTPQVEEVFDIEETALTDNERDAVADIVEKASMRASNFKRAHIYLDTKKLNSAEKIFLSSLKKRASKASKSSFRNAAKSTKKAPRIKRTVSGSKRDKTFTACVNEKIAAMLNKK